LHNSCYYVFFSFLSFYKSILNLTYHLHAPKVKKIWGLNLPDSHGPVQACSGTALLKLTRKTCTAFTCRMSRNSGSTEKDPVQVCNEIPLLYHYHSSSYPERDISCPLTSLRTVSSLYCQQHFLFRSGRQRVHFCLKILSKWTFCQDDRKGGTKWQQSVQGVQWQARWCEVMWCDAIHGHSFYRCHVRGRWIYVISL
jgi:hypothetical protein